MTSKNNKSTLKLERKTRLRKRSSEADSKLKNKPNVSKGGVSDESSQDDSDIPQDSESSTETECSSSAISNLSQDFSDEDKLMEYYESKIKEYSTLKSGKSTTESSGDSDVPAELVELMTKAKLEYRTMSCENGSINKINPAGLIASTSVQSLSPTTTQTSHSTDATNTKPPVYRVKSSASPADENTANSLVAAKHRRSRRSDTSQRCRLNSIAPSSLINVETRHRR